jgi:spermidine synthase
VREKLSADGVFSFRIPSAENYISPELQDFLSSLFYTLQKVFTNIEVVPGDTNVFLASSRELSLDYKRMNQKIVNYELQNLYVSSELLFSRLDPQRIYSLREKILAGKKTTNLNLAPISYFFSSVLWSKQFKGFEAKIFKALSDLSPFWLLDFPLLLFLLFLFLIGIKRKETFFYLTPLAVMGLTTIAVEIITIISFQAFYGYVYERIALLFASFMFGLFLGALFFTKRKKNYFQILLIQGGFILLLLLGQVILKKFPPEFFFYLFLLAVGLLGGALFVVSNYLFLETKKNYGIGYGLDLLGSFIGALAVSSILIPLVGLPLLLKYLFLLNSFCLVFLVWGLKASRQS